MDQGEARRRAKELDGIAVGARLSLNGHWTLGGWASQPKETWIVVDLTKRRVLDDRD